MLQAFEITVANAGTRISLAPVAGETFLCAKATVQAKGANAGSIYVGGADVDATHGIELLALDKHEVGGEGLANHVNLNSVYVDSSVNGDKVTVLAEVI